MPNLSGRGKAKLLHFSRDQAILFSEGEAAASFKFCA